MPQVKYGSTVLLHYTISLKNREIVESTAGGEPARITVGSGKVLRGIEEALEGMSPGESKRVTIAPEKAYGKRRPENVSRHSMDTAAPVGKSGGRLQHQVVDAGTPGEFSVDITDKGVHIDKNRHLAGQEVIADIDVVDIVDT